MFVYKYLLSKKEILIMLYTLKNDKLTVTVDDFGAQIMSVKGGDCEYVWQGNPEVWAGRTPILFPICGRLFTGKYNYEGNEYEMNLHGFARNTQFTVASATDTEIALTICSDEATLAQYPFDFKLTVSYVLNGNKVTSDVVIENTGKKTLPATFGAHPGFNVPLDNGSFDDWYIEFGENCTPNELMFSETCFNTGKKRPVELLDSKILPLRHSLFDVDAIFMDRVASSATLKSKLSDRSVTLIYPQMPYLGVWHKPRSEAPYVCIEPWCGLPSYDGQVDDMATKNDMFHILPNTQKLIRYEMIFN